MQRASSKVVFVILGPSAEVQDGNPESSPSIAPIVPTGATPGLKNGQSLKGRGGGGGGEDDDNEEVLDLNPAL